MATSHLFLIVTASEKLAAPACYKANSDAPTECLHIVGGPERHFQSNEQSFIENISQPSPE